MTAEGQVTAKVFKPGGPQTEKLTLAFVRK